MRHIVGWSHSWIVAKRCIVWGLWILSITNRKPFAAGQLSRSSFRDRQIKLQLDGCQYKSVVAPSGERL